MVGERSGMLLAAGVAFVVLAACGEGNGAPSVTAAPSPPTTASSATPTVDPSPTLSAGPTPSPTLVPTPTLPAAPDPGPCPVQTELCKAAVEIADLFREGDVDGLMARATGQPLECFGPDASGLPDLRQICGDAPAGTIVVGFMVSQGGEGSGYERDGFREWLAPAVEYAQTSEPGATDRHGSGEVRVAAIGCFREPTLPASECGREWIEVVITFISHSEPPSRAPGGFTPRSIVCLELYWPEGEQPGISGIGCGVPPDANLGARDGPANMSGVDGRFVNYPWTPEDPLP